MKTAPLNFTLMPLGVIETSKGFDLVDEQSLKLMQEAWEKDGKKRLAFDLNHGSLGSGNIESIQNYGTFVPSFDGSKGVVAADIRWAPEAKEAIENERIRYWSPTFVPELNDAGVPRTIEVEYSDRTIEAVRPARLINIALTETPATYAQSPITETRGVRVFTRSFDLNDEVVVERNNMEENKEVVAEVAADEDNEETSELEQLKAELDELRLANEGLKAENAELQARLDELDAEAEKAEVETITEALITEGYLNQGLRSFWLGRSLTDVKEFDKVCRENVQVETRTSDVVTRKAPSAVNIASNDLGPRGNRRFTLTSLNVVNRKGNK